MMSSSKSTTTTPATRSLRKRQPAKLADDIDFDLESLLKEHEKTGIEFRAQRDAKKLKNADDSDDDDKYIDAFKDCESIPLDSLPSLCIEKIFSMVSRKGSFDCSSSSISSSLISYYPSIRCVHSWILPTICSTLCTPANPSCP